MNTPLTPEIRRQIIDHSNPQRRMYFDKINVTVNYGPYSRHYINPSDVIMASDILLADLGNFEPPIEGVAVDDIAVTIGERGLARSVTVTYACEGRERYEVPSEYEISGWDYGRLTHRAVETVSQQGQ